MVAVFIGQVLGVFIIVLVYEGFQKLFKRTKHPKIYGSILTTLLFLIINVLGAIIAVSP